MSNEGFPVHTRVFKSETNSPYVSVTHQNKLTNSMINAFLDTVVGGTIGVAPSYGSRCVLNTIAFSSASQILLIHLSSSSRCTGKAWKGQENRPTANCFLIEAILCHPDITKYTFKMDKLSAAIYLDLGLHITNGVDMLSVAKGERHSVEALMSALGGETALNKATVIALFIDDETRSDIRATATRAWIACHAGLLPDMSKRLARVTRVNTQNMDFQHLSVLAKTVRDADRLAVLRPNRVKNEVDPKFTRQKGGVELVSTRFRTRVMRTEGMQKVEIVTCNGGQRSIATGTAKVNGRTATVALQAALHGTRICSVTTIGKEAPTSAEAMRGDVILKALQNTSHIMRNPFVRNIYLNEVASWAGIPPLSSGVALQFPGRELNTSQKKAVSAILSNDDASRITLVHGPPGTGKTTVIASAVTSVMTSRNKSLTFWLVAQSNVAVKNIAEKLAAVGFLDFKLLVSKDFHFDWHEHLYKRIIHNVIRSDDFVDSPLLIERLLLGSRVILCTLSMLSHHKLSPFMQLVPPQTMIFDEASQIEIGDYFPVLHRFRHTLSKLVFIGDDKQLAPYGQGDVNDLRSIFEMPRLRKKAVFLDTQYRMPVPVGRFISRKVYNNKLKTDHSITSIKSCIFVDVANGKEERKGSSWTNRRENQVAMSLARKYSDLGKLYRIITPYDAQRSLLEKSLQVEKLSWEDRCFNIDSFQGNEEDFIIVSLVRSENIGFLKEARRVNVMLTRCKMGMIVLTSRRFLTGKASSSLAAGLAQELGPETWVESKSILYGNFRPFC